MAVYSLAATVYLQARASRTAPNPLESGPPPDCTRIRTVAEAALAKAQAVAARAATARAAATGAAESVREAAATEAAATEAAATEAATTEARATERARSARWKNLAISSNFARFPDVFDRVTTPFTPTGQGCGPSVYETRRKLI